MNKMLLHLNVGIFIFIISTSLYEMVHSCSRRRRNGKSKLSVITIAFIRFSCLCVSVVMYDHFHDLFSWMAKFGWKVRTISELTMLGHFTNTSQLFRIASLTLRILLDLPPRETTSCISFDVGNMERCYHIIC